MPASKIHKDLHRHFGPPCGSGGGGIPLAGAPALFMGLLIASLNLGWIRVV
jgi:hypothetical protein